MHPRWQATGGTAGGILRGIDAQNPPLRAGKLEKRRPTIRNGSLTAIIDMRIPHGVKIPADATGIIRTCCSRIGLTLYHAASLHVNDKPLRGGYVGESNRETGLSSRDHRGDGKSLYCKPSHRRTASIRAAPQPQISRASSCSRSSSGSRCLSARRALRHMPV